MTDTVEGRDDASWPRRLGAEAVGTFALVFAAAGGDVMASISGDAIGTAARAVAPALIVAALIYAVGDASGAHFNPAISLAFTVRRLFPAAWLPAYWIAQLAGAVAAALLLRAMFGATIEAGVSTPHVPQTTALTIEIVLTMLLATIALGTADRYRIVGPNAALAVGATIAMAGLIALPIEGASMNPARSLGPALVAGDLEHAWIYVVGPVAGALLGVAIAWLLHGPPRADSGPRKAARGES